MNGNVGLGPGGYSTKRLSLRRVFRLHTKCVNPRGPFFTMSYVEKSKALSDVVVFSESVGGLERVTIRVRSGLAILLGRGNICRGIRGSHGMM